MVQKKWTVAMNEGDSYVGYEWCLVSKPCRFSCEQPPRSFEVAFQPIFVAGIPKLDNLVLEEIECEKI